MPNTATEFAQNAQEQTLSSIRQSQQAIVEAVTVWAQAVEKAVPETPALPGVGDLPTPQEIVQTSFDFAEQLLKAQRDFTESLLAAAAPAFAAPVVEKSTPKK
jgi:hypothetical protein